MANVLDWVIKALESVIWSSKLSEVSLVSELLAAHGVSNKGSVHSLKVLVIDFVCLNKDIVL